MDLPNGVNEKPDYSLNYRVQNEGIIVGILARRKSPSPAPIVFIVDRSAQRRLSQLCDLRNLPLAPEIGASGWKHYGAQSSTSKS